MRYINLQVTYDELMTISMAIDWLQEYGGKDRAYDVITGERILSNYINAVITASNNNLETNRIMPEEKKGAT